MTRRLAFLLGISLVLIAGAACGGGGGDKTVTGIVIDVQSTSLTDLAAFTVHTNDGDDIVFHVDPGASRDPQNGFAGGHLRSHMVGASQVKIYYHDANGDHLATRIVDIQTPSS